MVRCIIPLVIVFFGPMAFAAGFSYPKTKVAEQARDLIKICESKQESKFTPWVKKHFSDVTLKQIPPEAVAHMVFKFCKESGGLRPVSLMDSQPTQLALLVQGIKSLTWSELYFEIDGVGKILHLRPKPPELPESILPKDLSDASVEKEIRSSVKHLIDQGGFSGILLVARNGQPIVTVVGGYADRSKKTAITGSTQFTLASLSKMFTGVAAAQLVDQKKLSFDDKVGKFFPNYSNHTVRDKVTVGMLLAHTAGLGDFLGMRTPEILEKGIKRAEELLPLFDKEEPSYEPGSEQGYSNTGIALAGAIVEKVSGLAFPEYLRKNIFIPSGMTHSDPNNVPFKSPSLVTPYAEGQVADPDLGTPAGGAISTADDLVLFAEALRNGKLIRKETLAEMIKPRSKDSGIHGYGYTLSNDLIYGRNIIGHGGGYQGVSTSFSMILDSPYSVVILENIDKGSAEKISGYVLSLIAAKAKKGL